MVSYVVYHALQFPFLFVPPHKLKYLFRIKVVLLAPVVAGMAIWIAAKAHGRNGFFYQPSQLHGSERAWQWLSGMTSVTGGCSTLEHQRLGTVQQKATNTMVAGFFDPLFPYDYGNL